jgi:hypothetical protein
MRHGLRTYFGVVPLPRAYDFDRLTDDDCREIEDATRVFWLGQWPATVTDATTGETRPLDPEREVEEALTEARAGGWPRIAPANRHLYVRELED